LASAIGAAASIAAVDQLLHRHPFGPEDQPALRDAGDVDQVVEQARHVRHLPADDLHRARAHRRPAPTAATAGAPRCGSGQGIAQLMGQRCEEFVFWPVRDL
jgi:hypothetical protein